MSHDDPETPLAVFMALLEQYRQAEQAHIYSRGRVIARLRGDDAARAEEDAECQALHQRCEGLLKQFHEARAAQERNQ